MIELHELRRAALEIFHEALASADAGLAVRRAVRLEGRELRIEDATLRLGDGRAKIYSVAIGKAARPMACALTETLGERLAAGVITAPVEGMKNQGGAKGEGKAMPSEFSPATHVDDLARSGWRVFAGGHPLPNRESLAAAHAAFDLLRRADEEHAPVIFLISGGGSAMMELPRDERTTLEELREANRILVSCGASIAEVNAVRRAVSAVKGGGLARLAPRSDQVSLIVSDTGEGQEDAVASGPTFERTHDSPDAASVITHYRLEKILPRSIVRAALKPVEPTTPHAGGRPLRKHYVLLDNVRALESAAGAARSRGFAVEVARDVVEQPVEEGCSLLLSRLLDLRRRTHGLSRAASLISGGEFACPVRGGGVGGRNSESALRWAIEIDALAAGGAAPTHVVALSAGTDGIDGNSPAAGALADEETLRRARAMGLNALDLLGESDAHTFFRALNDCVVTGPTGTNVRDLRVMLAS